ncbi:MAG: polyhydroxyalkanoic acid system family protein [Xanthomonadales bacterium]|nr:polyhydroxyalkanoic acid system family protein [Xanthomonadales bacterium]
MAIIEIQRAHSSGLSGARDAANNVAEDMRDSYGVNYEWDDDVLVFHHPAVKGQIEIFEEEIQIYAKLSFMFVPFRSSFERHIHQHLDEKLG